MELKERQKLTVTVETGEQREIEILSVVEMDDKRYVIYTMQNEKGLYDIMANYLVTNEAGYDSFVAIDDIIDKIKIKKYIDQVFGDDPSKAVPEKSGEGKPVDEA